MSVELIIEQLELHIGEIDDELAALTVERDRATAALVALKGEVTAAPEAVTEPKRRELARSPGAQKPKKAAPSKPRKPGSGRPPKYDYDEAARIVEGVADPGAVLMQRFGVDRGYAGKMLKRIRGRAITPSQIRHEVQPIPADRKLTHDDNPTASPPAAIAAEPETVAAPVGPTASTNGWQRGMAAQLVG